MEHTRLIVAVAVAVAVVAAIAVVPRALGSTDDGAVAEPAASEPVVAPTARADPPGVGGVPLALVADEDLPPEPVQWAGGDAAIPTGTWWSSAVAGPGALGLWPQPLAVRIGVDGKVEVAAPALEQRPDGSRDAPFTPTLWFDVGDDARTTVVGSGPLHVVVAVTGTAGRVEMTLVSGSPVVELAPDHTVDLTVPGARPAGGAGATTRVGAATGPWVVSGGAGGAVTVTADGVRVTPGTVGRVAVGPVPDGADAAYDDVVTAVADHAVEATAEDLSVEDDGTTLQTLRITREGGGASPWTLMAHQQRTLVDAGPTRGTIDGPDGTVPVVTGAALTFRFPAVPVLWSAVPLPDVDLDDTDGAPPPAPGGSYFGGKAIYGTAARSDARRAGGADDDDATADDTAATEGVGATLAGLSDPTHTPSLRWEARWGSVVMTPAEFGAGTELNDHQLQYGYWVAAAAHEAERDPAGVAAYREVVDLLVADYAGAATMPGIAAALPDQRSWSPYEGHSWASGTAPFAAGNNLESVSESSLSWWAAARWLLATDRADLAATFVARFTIESAVTGDRWLPQGERLDDLAPGARPWSGVVWGAKSDLTTWFDPADESALGIRLLPVGPASLARYGSTDALDAAAARWAWCDDNGGCTDRWADLLDTDAAVAGRRPLSGPDPEGSTPAVLLSWWRGLWEDTEPAFDLSCSVGVVARRRLADGAIVVLASSPAPDPVTLACRDVDGAEVWSGPVQGAVAVVVG